MMQQRLVITTKSVKYMPFLLSFTGFVNGVCWTAYALIYKFDLFLTVTFYWPFALNPYFNFGVLVERF